MLSLTSFGVKKFMGSYPTRVSRINFFLFINWLANYVLCVILY